jgi:plastocyanin
MAAADRLYNIEAVMVIAVIPRWLVGPAVLAIGLGASLRAAAPVPVGGGVGRVEGLVRLVTASGPAIASGAYPSRRVSAGVAAAPEMSHVVVFLKGVPTTAAPSPRTARMVQKDESFEPAVVAIPAGSTVEFPNADPFFHNVFSLSRGAAFDLGRYRRGDSRSRTFTRAGLVKVYCHLHSHMTASILVFDHPWFVIPDAAGRFALPDVPAGVWQLVAWHERIGESAQPVRVETGQPVRAEFSLPVVTP